MALLYSLGSVACRVFSSWTIVGLKHFGQQYILVLWNALYTPLMNNHLIPPFILREVGLLVNKMPKIHTDAIYFKESDLQITLSLHEIFSYFPITKRNIKDRWDPLQLSMYI